MHQQMASTLDKMKQPHRQDNWFKDPRLMHLNPQFAFDVKIKQMGWSSKVSKQESLIEVLKYNNWANEFNYMVDIYERILKIAS